MQLTVVGDGRSFCYVYRIQNLVPAGPISVILHSIKTYPISISQLVSILDQCSANTIQKRNWLSGNTSSLFLETPYPELREWIKTLPNEGLLRYYIVGNLERVILTSPKALSELLVTKVYDFAKPAMVQRSLRRIVGDGILLAEGDAHRVRSNESP